MRQSYTSSKSDLLLCRQQWNFGGFIMVPFHPRSLISFSMVAEGPWIKVAKSRSQRKYQVLVDQLSAVAIDQSINQSCTVELTELNVKDTAWWSLALEAVGHEVNLMNSLQVLSRQVIKTYRGPELQAQNSYPYPRWLSIANHH